MAFHLTWADVIKLERVAAALRAAQRRIDRNELARKTRAVFRPLEKELRTSAAKTLPKRGGYAGIMSKAVRVSVRRSGGDFIATIYARGKTEMRDVVAVDRGRLRHPVWGRRRHPWKTTRVIPGFVTIPVRRLEDRIDHEALNELHEISVRLSRL